MKTAPPAKKVAIAKKMIFASSGATTANETPILISDQVETSIIGGGVGATTLPKKFFQPQTKLEIKAIGAFRNDVEDVANLKFTFRIKLNGTTRYVIETPAGLFSEADLNPLILEAEIWSPVADRLNLMGKLTFQPEESAIDPDCKTVVGRFDGGAAFIGTLDTVDTDAAIVLAVTVQQSGTAPASQLAFYRFDLTVCPRP